MTSTPPTLVRAVGLDTPGPASADGVISSKGSTNFYAGLLARLRHPRRAGGADRPAGDLQQRRERRRAVRPSPALRRATPCERSSVAAIVGTGLGGGVVESGRVVKGAAGMAGELGHVQIPLHGLLEDDQPIPRATADFEGDVESFASLTGIKKNLLPYWLTPASRTTRWPQEPVGRAAKMLRGVRREGGPAGAGGVRPAGAGDRGAVHHRGQLHRPARVLPRRRRGGGRPAIPAVVPQHRAGDTPSCATSRRRWPRSRWCPIWTWPARGARRWRPWRACSRRSAPRRFIDRSL